MWRIVFNLSTGAFVAAMLAFIYLPVVILVLFSFQKGLLPVPPFEGPSLEWYERAFSNTRLMDALRNSVLVAGFSALAATVLGFLAAYGMARRPPMLAGGLRFLIMAPITVSSLIIGLGLLIVFNLAGIPKSLLAVGIGHTIINLPICFAIIYSQFGDHHRNIDQAAHDLGAGDFQVITRIAVPIMRPAIFASFCLAATLSWDEFIIALLLSRFEVTLPVMIFEMLRAGLTPEVNAAGTIVFAISMSTVTLAAIAMLIWARER
ncbi:MAG TPA: ABC transporter permease [Alphaproteobacteria bacterium]|nr:ABC transporter permease [Alphaproteobacteria bacterium]